MTDKTFYIADDSITPLREGRAVRPSTADTTATRTTTANSLLSNAPFASLVPHPSDTVTSSHLRALLHPESHSLIL